MQLIQKLIFILFYSQQISQIMANWECYQSGCASLEVKGLNNLKTCFIMELLHVAKTKKFLKVEFILILQDSFPTLVQGF